MLQGSSSGRSWASPDFCTMRQRAMRPRGLLRWVTVDAHNKWLTDARSSNIHGVRRFARTMRQDMEAVSNAVLEPWSNGQAEGQINRLKMLKRAMFGRAGIEFFVPACSLLERCNLHRE